jgi:adenylate cyclase
VHAGLVTTPRHGGVDPAGEPGPACLVLDVLQHLLVDVQRDHLGVGQLPGQRRPPSAEERKVVTVLFADLVEFTSRAEQMDPEDVRALLSPFYARLRAELERFGGTVEKFIGDAVMALFGAPAAHEDDPERAVRAALAIRDWVRGRTDSRSGWRSIPGRRW